MHNARKSKQSDAQILQWTLSFAKGYIELGMYEDAGRELAGLGLKEQCDADVLELRVRVLLGQGRYARAARLARSAAKIYPGIAEFYSYAATAYEEMGMPEKAKRTWISAPSIFHVSGIFHFNLARFEAEMGNLEEARCHVALAIELDPGVEARVAQDPKLSRLHAARDDVALRECDLAESC